jgi:hypothetical protein
MAEARREKSRAAIIGDYARLCVDRCDRSVERGFKGAATRAANDAHANALEAARAAFRAVPGLR